VRDGNNEMARLVPPNWTGRELRAKAILGPHEKLPDVWATAPGETVVPQPEPSSTPARPSACFA